ncbi:hypothetical protein HYU15_03170 [Candidatus Woesearchaeota archaeon]|nr:hypothetical protein [Candidatus Woesearchaeota archaeon]
MGGCSLGLTVSQLGMYAELTAQYTSAFDYRNSERAFKAAGLPTEEIPLTDVLSVAPLLSALSQLGSTIPQIIAAGQEHIRQCEACTPIYETELTRARTHMESAARRGLEAVLAEVRAHKGTG